MTKRMIYFLCTGNSCRSQMAEGWAKKYVGDEWEIYSAGIEAHGLNPNAVESMKEAGIDISHQTSDIIDYNILNQADLVITLCGDAADKCPVTPPQVKREHWTFDDPAGKEWSEFQRVRDEIKQMIIEFSRISKL